MVRLTVSSDARWEAIVGYSRAALARGDSATIGPATDSDAGAIATLLRAGGLPVPDPLDPPVEFLVSRDAAGALAGCAGVERYGATAMLRSVAVATASRRTGVGRRLVDAFCRWLAADGTRDVYLLTVDAAPFFARLGFAPADRAAAPAALTASPLWREEHCSRATLMRRSVWPDLAD